MSFVSPPDFETPTDTNGDNLYVVIVQASDGGLSSLQAVLITVRNIVSEALPGDYNQSGAVDAADYVVWRRSHGQVGNGLPADGNGNGHIDGGDYNVWRANFGRSVSPASSASVFDAVRSPPIPLRDEKGSAEIRAETAASAMVSLRRDARTPTASARPYVLRTALRNPRVEGGLQDEALVAWLAVKSAALRSVRSFTGLGEFEIQPIHHERVDDDALEVAFLAFE
jgi:hypothetical protein